MKTFLKRVSILVVGVLVLSCSSDSSTPAEVVKTRVKITQIQVNTIPQYNGSLLWDSLSDPDIFIKLHDETSNVGTTASTTIWNFVPTLANSFLLNFTTPIQSTDLINTSLTVQVYDDDSDDSFAGADDKIGEVTFNIYPYTVGADKYPLFDVKLINGTMVTIHMVWE
jgi:hypothetical protein